MKKVLYIFSLILDILEYLARCISNLVDKFTKRNKNYDDITAIEYLIDKEDISTNILIFNKDRHSFGIENIWDKKILLQANRFEDIIYYLKKHGVLKYKKYYHTLEFHSYSDMYTEDNTDTQDVVTIYFKDGFSRKIISLDNNKKINELINYLKEIN